MTTLKNVPSTSLSHVNLTAITWAHAVNSQKLLDDTLKSKIFHAYNIRFTQFKILLFPT